MPERAYQICSRCVMDTTDPLIEFDGNGTCNHCTEFIDKRSKHNYQGAESDQLLLGLVSDMKKAGKGREYDCVLGVSGGIDSSYAAHIAVKHGLRVLAVHLDNGWNSEDAVLNIRYVAEKLGIDYMSYVLDWEEFKDLQLAFLKASVPEAETPTDIAIPAALHKVAADHGIRYIISGGNFATEGILPKCWHYNAKDTTYLKHIQKTFGTRKLKKFPLFGFVEEAYYKLVKGMRIIYMLNYVPYAKDEAMQLLQNELNWRYYGGKHYESKYTGFIQSYYLYSKFNIDYRRATLATQICTGEVTREQALIELSKPPFTDAKVALEKEYIAKKLGISEQEFEDILARPAKFYWEYPNDEKRLGFIYDTYRKLFKKEKLASF
jgi:N-acetyl sugar amidotransferase